MFRWKCLKAAWTETFSVQQEQLLGSIGCMKRGHSALQNKDLPRWFFFSSYNYSGPVKVLWPVPGACVVYRLAGAPATPAHTQISLRWCAPGEVSPNSCHTPVQPLSTAATLHFTTWNNILFLSLLQDQWDYCLSSQIVSEHIFLPLCSNVLSCKIFLLSGVVVKLQDLKGMI